MCDFESISGSEIVALASVIAISISENKSANELNLLAAFFTCLGDNLTALALTKPHC